MPTVVRRAHQYRPALNRSTMISSAWRPSMSHRAHQVAQLTSALSYLLFGRAAGDQFVQQSLAGLGTQDAAQALDILALCAVAADNNRHTTVGHIRSEERRVGKE